MLEITEKLSEDGSMLEVKAYKTQIFNQGEDLIDFITNEVGTKLMEGDILAVTSKIISLWVGQVVSKKEMDKETLIRQEADVYLGSTDYGVHLTIKENQLFPSSGIDESNCRGDFWILFPQNPYLIADQILSSLKERLQIKKLGLLITDSKTTPLRRGVTGTALAYSGFHGVTNKRGSLDLFGRPLKITEINQADALAAAAVLLMGEGNEAKPLAIIKTVVTFGDTSPSEIRISPEEDLYSIFFKNHE